MKEKIFSFILGGVLGFLIVCSLISAFDYVCDLRFQSMEATTEETETTEPAQEETETEYIFGVATSKHIYYETYDMIVTTADGTEWIVYDYICPLNSSVMLKVENGLVLEAVATTKFGGGEIYEG